MKARFVLVMLMLIFVLGTTAMAAEGLKGHTIKVDKNVHDWIGTPPDQENTGIVSSGEYIWKDAKGDDTGNGKYTYPTNKDLGKGADLREFRVTWDKNNVYFLIKCSRPGNWWAPYRIIGIHKEGEKDGMTVLGQGDADEMDPAGGNFGELKVDPALACQYVIGIGSTYKMWMWDAKGKTVAWTTGEKSTDTPGFLVADENWNSVEIAVPIELIGNPAGQTWKFVVGVGLQDSDHFREVFEEATEWHGGGGEGDESEVGPDPDVYDLASPSLEIQEQELGSFKASANAGDPDGFATIKDSYVTVSFAK
jgi:hypothetical protein